MLAVAEQHELHEFVIKAEAALRDSQPSAPARADEAPKPMHADGGTPSKQVATIARAIADMRIAAGLSA
jgi:hypothetical protein